MVETAYPVRRILAFAAQLEASMAEHGLHRGCERFFQHLAIPRALELPKPVRAVAQDAPVVFFGNHPSLFTPFLVVASINRLDVRWFSSKYVCNLLPSIKTASFPMEVPLTRSWTEWRRGGWKRALIYRMIALLHDMPKEEEIRASNRANLLAGAKHVRKGGSVILCPGGGGKARDRKWYAGIGALIKELQRSHGERAVYLVPFREENCSNKRIYAYLQRGLIARIKKVTVHKGPIRLRFATPIPVAKIETSDRTDQQIADSLKARYERLFRAPFEASPQ
jgi:hypothetical protein